MLSFSGKYDSNKLLISDISPFNNKAKNNYFLRLKKKKKSHSCALKVKITIIQRKKQF